MYLSQGCSLSDQDCSIMPELMICRNSCEDAETAGRRGKMALVQLHRIKAPLRHR